MSHAWFLYSNQVVAGPFSTEQVQEMIDRGQMDADCYIWWKGQREWLSIRTWQEELPRILEAAVNQVQKPVWYIDAGQAPMGPLTQKELVDNLRAIHELTNVRLWAVGMKKWTGLFEMHDVMELLGISRREHERAPLMGTVAVTRANEDPKGFVVRAASISIAGIGLSGAHDLRRGDDLALLIRCADLPGSLHLRGQVVYVTATGYAGVRFDNVVAESQAIILDYVKRFKMPDSYDDQSAA